MTAASYWLADAPAFAATAPLPQAPVDVAVIGAGIAGVSTALHLSELGAEVALLDAGVVAGRASGRNDGQLLLGLGEHYNRIVGQFGADRARVLWAFLRRNHDAMLATVRELGIDCGLVQQGGLRLAETGHEAAELRTASALLTAEGIAHELLSPLETLARFPAGRGWFGALFLPGEAIVHPARMVRGLCAEAARRGAAVVEHAPVLRIEGAAGDFAVHLRDGRALAARAVVFCTSALARELDPTGFLQRVVFPFRGQVLATDPLPDDVLAGFPRCAMSSNFCYEYFRVHGQRLFLGGMRWSVKGEEQGLLDDDTTNDEVAANLRAYAARHFAVPVEFPHAWTGIMAGTPDGLPLLGGLPGAPGMFVLGAFNGYGLSFAFLAGRCAAQMVVDGSCPDPAMPLFAPRRFA
ncbi:MAG: NAD(P)/FAD-dependent oxidoreductase [Planctomycetota bacterium]